MREPIVYDYLNPVRFIDDWLSWKQASSRNPSAWTLRAFAQRAEMGSGTLVNILKGRRKPTSSTAHAVGQAMRLPTEQTEFLVRLAALHRSRPGEQLRRAVAAVFESEQWHAQRRLDDKQIEQIDTWLLFSVRDLVQLPGFQEDPDWICRRLGHRLEPDDVAACLDRLLVLGLLARREDGTLTTASRLHTPAEVHGPSTYQVHHSALELAADALSRVPPGDRYFGIVGLLIPRSAFAAVRDRVVGFLTEVANFADAQDEPAEELVQLQLQVFRMEEARTDDLA